MSSTNKTTNYELSQFVSTDKPAWLTDYNQDMSKIDAGIHSAQSTATGADGKADANTTNIGDLTYLSTTAKNTIVAAINEVDSDISTVSGVASNAAGTATSAKNKADGLEAYFKIVNTGSVTPTTDNGTINFQNLYYASNEDGSLGKIYGEIGVTPSTNTETHIKFNTPFRPSQSIDINGNLILQRSDTKEIYYASYTIAPNGEVTITLSSYFYSTLTKIVLIASLTYFEPFAESN